MLKTIVLNFFTFKEDKTPCSKFLSKSAKKNIYTKALTHKSFDQKANNEQLEFLGDAVLSSIISEFLFLDNPKKEEGFLSQQRAIIVSRRHLNLVGKKIIPENQIKKKIRESSLNIFGNTLEAIIGAIYIEKGILEVKIFVRKHIYKSEFLPLLLDTDYKSQLLKYSQKEKINVEYVLEKKIGLDHKKEFYVSTLINGKKITEANASSKKAAEQKAAQKAIKKLIQINENLS